VGLAELDTAVQGSPGRDGEVYKRSFVDDKMCESKLRWICRRLYLTARRLPFEPMGNWAICGVTSLSFWRH